MRRTSLNLDHLADFFRLCRAAHRAYKAKRDRNGRLLSHQSLAFMLNVEDEVITLQRELLSNSYTPGPFRHFWVCDRKPRFISAAPFRDRVVHHSLTALLSPRLERYADPHSYACRPQRGLHRAIHYAQKLSNRYQWALRLDVAHYFETLPHQPLKDQLRRLFKGDPTLAIADRFIDHAPLGCAQGRGLPIGNLTSQHYANLYLGQLDHALRQEFKIGGYLRYMDDMTLFAQDKKTLQAAHRFVATFLQERLSLTLKDSATRLGPSRLGIPLLGFRVFPSHIRFDRSRLKRYRLKRRQLDQLWRKGLDEEELRPRSEALSAWAQVANTYQMRRRHAYRLADET